MTTIRGDRKDQGGNNFRFAAVAVALGLLSSPAAAGAQVLFAPDGTYEYSLKQGSSTVATSTVSVKRSGSVIASHEAQSVQDPTIGVVQITADESMLADSLDPLSFSAVNMASGKNTSVKLVMNGSAGTFFANDQRLTVPVRLLPDTQAMLVQDQTLVTSFLSVPGLVQGRKLTALTQVSPTARSLSPMRVDPAAQTKPGSAPASDVGVGIASPVAFSVWFDPRTGVVDEIDVPSQSLVISLLKRS